MSGPARYGEFDPEGARVDGGDARRHRARLTF
jgi:hypothetical protein